jgi:predicted O-methyltransferase YrrM
VNPILMEIEASGSTRLPDGQLVPLHSAVGPDSGRVLRQAVALAKPRLACEVGLAFGVSSLYLLDAMSEHGDGTLIGMDPAQHDHTWRGGGLHNIARAGFADRYEFFGETSQRVLPRLVESGRRIQLGFIDGWHTFDHTLVDFFYMDQMLDVGGVIVLDDVGYPGLKRLAEFILSNRSYSLVDAAYEPVPSNFRRRAKGLAQKLLEPLVRDDSTPGAATRARLAPLQGAMLIALRKDSDDVRRFDHFEPF